MTRSSTVFEWQESYFFDVAKETFILPASCKSRVDLGLYAVEPYLFEIVVFGPVLPPLYTQNFALVGQSLPVRKILGQKPTNLFGFLFGQNNITVVHLVDGLLQAPRAQGNPLKAMVLTQQKGPTPGAGSFSNTMHKPRQIQLSN